MPRIRRIKDYDFEFNSEDYSPDGEESDSEGNSQREYLHGESWLSTKAVIARIPDAILRRSLKYYREIVSTVETEIRQRDSGLKPHISDDRYNAVENEWQTVRSFWIPESDRKKYSQSSLRVPRRKNKERTPLQGFIRRTLKSLNSVQKSQLLEEWSLIFKTLNKELHNASFKQESKESD